MRTSSAGIVDGIRQPEASFSREPGGSDTNALNFATKFCLSRFWVRDGVIQERPVRHTLLLLQPAVFGLRLEQGLPTVSASRWWQLRRRPDAVNLRLSGGIARATGHQRWHSSGTCHPFSHACDTYTGMLSASAMLCVCMNTK